MTRISEFGGAYGMNQDQIGDFLWEREFDGFETLAAEALPTAGLGPEGAHWIGRLMVRHDRTGADKYLIAFLIQSEHPNRREVWSAWNKAMRDLRDQIDPEWEER
jgi:hypothetical protein